MKAWYRSRTMWVQLATFAIGVLTLATEYVPERYMPWILFGIGVINVALRLDTSEPITLRTSELDAE